MKLREVLTVGDLRSLAEEGKKVFIRFNGDSMIYEYELHYGSDGDVYYITESGSKIRMALATVSSILAPRNANRGIEYVFYIDRPQFSEGEMVEVSRDEKNWYKRIFICTLSTGRHVTVCDTYSDQYMDNQYSYKYGNYIEYVDWPFIQKIQVDPDVVITSKDGQEIRIKKSKAIELGFQFN